MSSGLSAAAHGLVEAFVTHSFHIPSAATEDRPKSWYRDKIISEGACLLPSALARRATELKMPPGGLARKTMDHFLSGSAEAIHVDLNAELARNAQLREYVTSHIELEIAQRAKKGEAVPI